MIAKSAGHIDQEVKLAVNEGSGAFDRVHTSHKRAMVNQIVFCIKCGRAEIREAKDVASGWAAEAENTIAMYHNFFPQEPNEVQAEEPN